MPLVLINTRNHCYCNVAVQLLFNIPKIRYFFQQEKFRINGPKLSMPISDALSVIFKTDGKMLASTEALRCIVAEKSGIASFFDGSMEDSLYFLTTLLKMLKEEIPQDILDAHKIVEDFEGAEKVKRKFLNNIPEGKCPNCQRKQNDSHNQFCWMIVIPNMINTQINLKLSVLMREYFKADQAEMKCSNCCQHISHCPLTGLCKMKPIENSSE